MLAGEDKVRIGEEPIEDVEHAAHHGHESEKTGFAGGDIVAEETLVNTRECCVRFLRPPNLARSSRL